MGESKLTLLRNFLKTFSDALGNFAENCATNFDYTSGVDQRVLRRILKSDIKIHRMRSVEIKT